MKAYSTYEKIHEQLRKQNNVRYVLIQHSILTPPRVSLSVSLSLSLSLSLKLFANFLLNINITVLIMIDTR